MKPKANRLTLAQRARKQMKIALRRDIDGVAGALQAAPAGRKRLRRLGLAGALLLGSACGANAQSTQCVQSVLGGGAVNAITTPMLQCGLTTNLLTVTALGANTSTTVTLQPVGLAALPIKRPDGSALQIGDIPSAGYRILLQSTGLTWVMLNPAVISAGQLPTPTASALGGVKSSTAPTNQFATGIDTNGNVTYAQPTAGNISGLYPYANGAAGTGFNGIATGYSAASQALWLVGTYSGDGSAPYALVSATDTGQNSAAIISGGGNPLSAFTVTHNLGAAGAGNRFAINSVFTKTGVTAGTDTSKKFYTPIFSRFYVQAEDGGNGGTPLGAHYGLSSLIEVSSAGKYLDAVHGAEIDVAMQSGSSAALKVGLLLASVNSDAVKGSTFDGMLAFGADATTTAKWTYGAAFGWPRGPWPFDSTSTLIGTVAPGSGSRVANWFLDGTSVTYTSGFIRSTGFSVGPTGAISASTISTVGTSAGLVVGSRSGSGNSYQWYNQTGAGLKLTDGGSDLVSLTSTGAIYAGAEITPASKTFAGLPTCNAGTQGAIAEITDGAGALVWGANASGGGSTKYLVHCNSANWTVAGK